MFIIRSTMLLVNTASPLAAASSSLSSQPQILKITPPNSVEASCTPFALNTPTIYPTIGRRRTRGGRKWTALNKAGDNQSVTVASPATTNTHDHNVVDSAPEVVRNFYARINAHDVDSVHDLIAENCVYEDLVFSRPFVGRKEILDFFKKFTNSTSTELQFVIDDLSTEDSSSVGAIWHLEWKGKPFPFSKGCSFYRLEVTNGKRQITYGRDSVEPAIKPGDATLAVIRSVTWLLQQFPQLADRLQ